MKITKKELQNLIKEQAERIIKEELSSKEEIVQCFVKYLEDFEYHQCDDYLAVNNIDIDNFNNIKREIIKLIQENF